MVVDVHFRNPPVDPRLDYSQRLATGRCDRVMVGGERSSNVIGRLRVVRIYLDLSFLESTFLGRDTTSRHLHDRRPCRGVFLLPVVACAAPTL